MIKKECVCGQRVSITSGARATKTFECPKCKRLLFFGMPTQVGNFKVGEVVYEEDGFSIALSRQAALQVGAIVLLFKKEEHPEAILAAKKLALAPFKTPLRLLDMGEEQEWVYVALRGRVEPAQLAGWFLHGTLTGVKKSFFKSHVKSIVAVLLTVILSITLFLLHADTHSKAADMYASKDWKQRRAALLLVEQTDEGFDLLVKALHDKRHYVRVAACQGLAKRKEYKKARKALEEALQDNSKTVRRAAIKALKSLPDSKPLKRI